MSMRVIEGAAAVSEFVAGYKGDCGETAELAGLHVVDPAQWPLTAAALKAIVQRDIGRGWASASGAEPLSSIAKDLAAVSIAYVNHGYGEPLGYRVRPILDQWGGIRPLVIEVAVAGNLPGNEAGVRYHFICCLGWDPVAGVGLFANGDGAEARGGSLARYTMADLDAAKVCGVLEITTPVKGWHEHGVPAGWKDDGTTLTAPSGIVVVKGFRDYVLAHGWDAQDEPMAVEAAVDLVEIGNPSLGDGSVQWFRKSGQLTWTQARGVFRTWNGQELAALRAALAAALKDAPSAAEVAALAAIRGVAAALKAAEAEV